MTPIVVELSGVPTGKGRPRFVRATGRAYTPGKTRSYEDNLRFAAQAAMAGRAPIEGPLSVSVLAIFPIADSWSGKKKRAALAGEIRPTTKPDADNLLKVLDSFNEVVWKDDKQVVDATITKLYGMRPRFRVCVAVADPDSLSLHLQVAA